MKNIDMRSFIIGLLSSVCLFLFFGHTKTTDEITCSRLTIVNDDGKEIVVIANNESGAGYIHTANKDELINTKITNGKIWNYNQFGAVTSYAGQSDDGDGLFTTNNKYESQTTYIGSNTSNSGLIAVSGKNGNRTASIYSSNGSGSLSITNNIGNEIVYLGATDEDSGMLNVYTKNEVKGLSLSDAAMRTYSEDGTRRIYIGNSTEDNGLVVLSSKEIESGLVLTSNQIQIKHDSENDALLLGTGYMFMYNNDGARRTYLGYNSDTYDGMFNLYDKRGEVIFNK